MVRGMAPSLYYYKIKGYEAFRHRTYVLPMSVTQVITFYEKAFPGLQGGVTFSVPIKGNQVDLSARPNEGLMVFLSGKSGAPPRTNKFGDLLHRGDWPTDIHSFLQIMNVRDVRHLVKKLTRPVNSSSLSRTSSDVKHVDGS